MKTSRTIIRASWLRLLPGVHFWSIYQVVFLASLLLCGKIEVRKDSVVYVQVVGSLTTGEWKTAFAVV